MRLFSLLLLSLVSSVAWCETPQAIGKSEKFIRLQPYEALPEGIGFVAQNLMADPKGNIFLQVALSQVQDKITFNSLDYSCPGKCVIAVPISRRSETIRMEYQGRSVLILVSWVALPVPQQFQPTMQFDPKTGVKAINDQSGFDPSVYSLVLDGKKGQAKQVASEDVPGLSARLYSYAVSEASQWRMVIMRGDKLISAEEKTGAIPETIILGNKFPANPAPGIYTTRLDMAYARKFYPGQEFQFEILPPKGEHTLYTFEVGTVALTQYSDYSISPYLAWAPKWSLLAPNTYARFSFALAFVKKYPPVKTIPFAQISGQMGIREGRWGFELGLGFSTWFAGIGSRLFVMSEVNYEITRNFLSAQNLSAVLNLGISPSVPSSWQWRLGLRADF